MLGCSAQDVVSLIRGDVLALHQDSLGLADHLPGGQRGLDGIADLVLVGLGGGEGQAGHGSEDHPLGPVQSPESQRIAGVEDEGGAWTGVVG